MVALIQSPSNKRSSLVDNLPTCGAREGERLHNSPINSLSLYHSFQVSPNHDFIFSTQYSTNRSSNWPCDSHRVRGYDRNLLLFSRYIGRILIRSQGARVKKLLISPSPDKKISINASNLDIGFRKVRDHPLFQVLLQEIPNPAVINQLPPYSSRQKTTPQHTENSFRLFRAERIEATDQ